jgi:hypothetical protein
MEKNKKSSKKNDHLDTTEVIALVLGILGYILVVGVGTPE